MADRDPPPGSATIRTTDGRPAGRSSRNQLGSGAAHLDLRPDQRHTGQPPPGGSPASLTGQIPPLARSSSTVSAWRFLCAQAIGGANPRPPDSHLPTSEQRYLAPLSP